VGAHAFADAIAEVEGFARAPLGVEVAGLVQDEGVFVDTVVPLVQLAEQLAGGHYGVAVHDVDAVFKVFVVGRRNERLSRGGLRRLVVEGARLTAVGEQQ
jgi:hypothetical protein